MCAFQYCVHVNSFTITSAAASRGLRRMPVAAIAALVLAVAPGGGVAAADVPGLPASEPPVAAVSPLTQSLISVFRQTDPAPPLPAAIGAIFKPDAGGNTIEGANTALARPAYPHAGNQKDAVWLIPAAGEKLMCFVQTGTAVGGGDVPLSDPAFQSYGTIQTSGYRSRNGLWHQQFTLLVPDAITKVKFTYRRRGRKIPKKTFTPHDNVVVVKSNRVTFISMGGARFDVRKSYPPLKKKG